MSDPTEPIDVQVEAIRTGAAIAARPEVRTLRLSGPDRTRFLNGMVTNDVAALSIGQGVMAAKTNNRGRIEGFLRARAAENSFYLDVLAEVADRVRETLERFIIMDDCAVEDVSNGRCVHAVLGPKAQATLGAAGFELMDLALANHAFEVGPRATIIRDRTLGVAGYEVHTPTDVEVIGPVVAAGGCAVGPEALDVVRVESGVPIDGRDLDDDTVPMEARLEYAISFDKGCYVGQEVIARASTQGQVNHLLVGVRIDGDEAPPEGTKLFDAASQPGDRELGELTSVVRSKAMGGVIALGYVRRKAASDGTALQAQGADGRKWSATVADLPFVRP